MHQILTQGPLQDGVFHQSLCHVGDYRHSLTTATGRLIPKKSMHLTSTSLCSNQIFPPTASPGPKKLECRALAKCKMFRLSGYTSPQSSLQSFRHFLKFAVYHLQQRKCWRKLS